VTSADEQVTQLTPGVPRSKLLSSHVARMKLIAGTHTTTRKRVTTLWPPSMVIRL